MELDKNVDYNATDLENLGAETKLKCHMPSNDDAIDRVHMFHFFQRSLFQSDFSPPIEERLVRESCKVLDVGCGPGTWLLDLANKYENSSFYGIDNNLAYPNEIKPGNLNFVRADVFDRFPFPDNKFDYAHQGLMRYTAKPEQWSFLISEMIRVVKPGGYIELLATSRGEFKGTGPVLMKLHEAHFSYCLEKGIDTKTMPNLDKIIKLNPDTPIVNRDEKFFISGPNGGKIGMVYQDIHIGFHKSEATTEILSPILGISKEEYKTMITKDLIEELKHTSPEYSLIRFWAKKINNN
ncbi:S-adenosyl-L-methionine-dependent methyltransferase [Rhizophagus clarus]|nr:S-adenosyl-L-methionine-dependent methyltransferase [Rhizophagus clarus]